MREATPQPDLLPEDFADLVAHYPAVEAVEVQDGHVVVHMATATARGTSRFYARDLCVSEARQLADASIRGCPFAPNGGLEVHDV